MQMRKIVNGIFILASLLLLFPSCYNDNEYDLYPNYLKANHVVFDKLLQRCIADGIENCDTLKQDEPLELGGYISHQWALQYTPDDLIPEFQFLLVYDPSINI